MYVRIHIELMDTVFIYSIWAINSTVNKVKIFLSITCAIFIDIVIRVLQNVSWGEKLTGISLRY